MLGGTDIKVVAEVATGQAAVNYVLKNEVDVVLLDVRMPAVTEWLSLSENLLVARMR